jgi:hypothetical protein
LKVKVARVENKLHDAEIIIDLQEKLDPAVDCAAGVRAARALLSLVQTFDAETEPCFSVLRSDLPKAIGDGL